MSTETWDTSKNGPIPANMLGQAHTHPNLPYSKPEPSMGGTKNDPHDDSAAAQIKKPVYVVTGGAIWKVDPSGKKTKEEGPEWHKGRDPKKCSCTP